MAITEVKERRIKVCVHTTYEYYNAVVRDGEIISMDSLVKWTVEHIEAYIVFCHEVLRAINESTE